MSNTTNEQTTRTNKDRVFIKYTHKNYKGKLITSSLEVTDKNPQAVISTIAYLDFIQADWEYLHIPAKAKRVTNTNIVHSIIDTTDSIINVKNNVDDIIR